MARYSQLRDLIVWSLLCTMFVPAVRGQDKSPELLLAPPRAEMVREQALRWTASRAAGKTAILEDVAEIWVFEEKSPSPAELLDRSVETFCRVDQKTNTLVASCRFQDAPLLPPHADILEPDELDPFYADNMRLFLGRYLAQRKMYEESLEVLARVDVTRVIDPAACLFFKSVCQHSLLMKEEGLQTIEQLLQRTEGIPIRYRTVATLMQYDLKALKPKSLEEISRKMNDVQRRLGLGRSGQKVQKVEDEIIAGLDDIIKKLESQKGGGGGSSGAGNQSNNPAQDSAVKGAKGPGNVDPKKFKTGEKWGDLNNKLRGRVRQLIGRDLPTHYRRAVEEYFRKAAKRAAPKSNK